MNKKLFILVVLITGSKSLLGMGPCYYGRNAQQLATNTASTSSANSTAIQEITKKLQSLESKDAEVNTLKKDLDETKNLLKSLQAQSQNQNSVAMQQKSEIMDVLTNFTQRTQSLIAESAKQNVTLQTKVEQLLESRKRIEGMLSLFETSKTIGWEAFFIEALREELK
ncbi:hypothetical protein BH09DEP1_BH09DEP1_1720 [soil metagenome]